METPTATAGARGRARHREVPRTSREQPSKAQGIGREQPMPKRAIDPRTSRDAVVSTGAGIALERAASGRRRWQRWAASHTSREQLHRRQVSRRSGAKRLQPKWSRPGDGDPKSSRRHVGFSLGFSLASSSNGLRRSGPLRGARGGGSSAGCMNLRFGGERLLSIVVATVAAFAGGAVVIAAETVA